MEWQLDEPGKRGRPSRLWRLAAGDELAGFDRACDELKARLLRRQLDDYWAGREFLESPALALRLYLGGTAR